ncbi:hypothetical protein [Sphingomonas soli]|uniref:hypothetical protein n=1 Tax=Sphingomonas soli TaxID=266127 RepID=UPI00083486DF|nr:hypothetical protein [Sphingomonas soli]
MRAPLFHALLLVLMATGCSRGTQRAEVAASVAQRPVARPMPVPPASAAPNLLLPARLPDGDYATPNRNLSEAATIWHVRSAFNVAVLTCTSEPGLAPDYNQLLRLHREPLKRAHASLAAEQSGGFDATMTRVYNYFSQPPVQRDFCPAAKGLLAEALATPPAAFPAFAREALLRLDAPFIAFYRAYDAYRADLALWRAGGASPRIAYDSHGFLSETALAGGGPAQIAIR